ncbi:hypothetical protein YC2023_086749 [Brassica napus]
MKQCVDMRSVTPACEVSREDVVTEEGKELHGFIENITKERGSPFVPVSSPAILIRGVRVSFPAWMDLIASYGRLMFWCRTYPLVDDRLLAPGPTPYSSVLDRRLLAPFNIIFWCLMAD